MANCLPSVLLATLCPAPGGDLALRTAEAIPLRCPLRSITLISCSDNWPDLFSLSNEPQLNILDAFSRCSFC